MQLCHSQVEKEKRYKEVAAVYVMSHTSNIWSSTCYLNLSKADSQCTVGISDESTTTILLDSYESTLPMTGP